MDTLFTDNPEEPLAETPEDVAILYSWANLHGAKYRDFSASRREYRAQVRHRAAEELRQSELEAKAEAEAAAGEAERVAREAERAARNAELHDSSANREHAIREAEDAARRAAAERVEAARRAEAAALAESMARKEEREIAEAHASAQRQAKSYTDAESRRRMLAGPQPVPVGLASDPYEQHQVTEAEMEAFQAQRIANYGAPESSVKTLARSREESRRASGEIRPYSGERRALQAGAGDAATAAGLQAGRGVRGLGGASAAGESRSRRLYGRASHRGSDEPARVSQPYQPQDRMPGGLSQVPLARNDASAAQQRQLERELSGTADTTPAWLYGSAAAAATAQMAPRTSFAPDTLQYSRERVASRWFALKGVFEPGQEPEPEAASSRRKETRTPPLAVFSLAGGVGKTSLVATLGRALSSLGEKVLLADTTSHGLLPYYFGASELRPGVVRTFSPPSGSTDAPIYLVSYDVDKRRSDRSAGALCRRARAQRRGHRSRLAGSERELRVDDSPAGRMSPTVLVPVAPDMNSVISLQTVERYFPARSIWRAVRCSPTTC